MRIIVTVCILLVFIPSARAQKEALSESIKKHSDASWDMAQKIWAWAEPGYQEKRSAELLAGAMEKAGFKVERGVAKMPTAFTATIGEGKPIIGVLGEYDALPGLSQEAVPFKQPAKDTKYGHGCGHHLFGVASASASIALGEQIKAGKIKGTLRFYGCPAEEGGSAKAFMVRAGVFDDCDVVLHWHPSSKNSAGDASCLARLAVRFRFHGKSTHAAGSPEKGRSSLDAVALTTHATELLREHVPDSTRIHYIITHGGDAPNVVPDFAEVYYYIRHPKGEVVQQVYPRLIKCAQGAALATETRLEAVHEGGIREIFPNDVLAQVMKTNLEKLNDLKYTDEEKAFAVRLQETMMDKLPLDEVARVQDVSGTVGMGSTDVGDVSWVVPTGGFTTACWIPGTPGHSWQAVASGGTTIGRKGMDLAARTIAASAWDLYHDPQRIAAAKAEHKRRLSGRKYEPLLEPGQTPPFNYRDPPRR